MRQFLTLAELNEWAESRRVSGKAVIAHGTGGSFQELWLKVDEHGNEAIMLSEFPGAPDFR